MRVVVAVVLISALAEARGVRVRAHVNKKTGTYVPPAFRSAPNHTKADNYGTKGNANPHTGKAGTKEIK